MWRCSSMISPPAATKPHLWIIDSTSTTKKLLSLVMTIILRAVHWHTLLGGRRAMWTPRSKTSILETLKMWVCRIFKGVYLLQKWVILVAVSQNFNLRALKEISSIPIHSIDRNLSLIMDHLIRIKVKFYLQVIMDYSRFWHSLDRASANANENNLQDQLNHNHSTALTQL